ncbi:hypothetical protein AMTR_s00003p00271470 [Amborella trichopoda]|uniref:Uncharacterized protein n=1 Tax=Amborella trichopoda TaxID=13333 RepID=W1P122_AMBTC|nr:hypothetical protein AMTR_s00003p00271470 [Amborella trichopoda]
MASATLVAWLLIFVSIFAVRQLYMHGPKTNFPPLKLQLSQLQSKVCCQEYKIKEKSREWERKEKQKLTQEKSEGISSMQK